MFRLLVTPRWLVRHVLMLALVAVCLVAARWQLGRAVERHSIQNWSYTVEWVLFAGFVVFGWSWFLRDDLRGPEVEAPADSRDVEPSLPVAQPVSDEQDPELAAYNRYLAELNAKRG